MHTIMKYNGCIYTIKYYNYSMYKIRSLDRIIVYIHMYVIARVSSATDHDYTTAAGTLQLINVSIHYHNWGEPERAHP